MDFKGSMTIHPAPIVPLNRGFTPTPRKVAWAKKALEAFEEGMKKGTATVSVEGRIVDIPIAEKVKQIIARAEVIAK